MRGEVRPAPAAVSGGGSIRAGRRRGPPTAGRVAAAPAPRGGTPHRTGAVVGWVDRYAGFCHRTPLPSREWRPSIYERRCRRPPAAYPCTRAGSPDHAHCLALLRVGFTEPCRSPGMLVVSYTAFSPLLTCTPKPARERFLFCGTGLRVTPSGRYPPPCPAEPGRSSVERVLTHRPTRPPGRPIRQPF